MGKPGDGANTDRKRSLLRRADTAASNRFSISGREKSKVPAKPSLPKVKCLDSQDEDDRE